MYIESTSPNFIKCNMHLQIRLVSTVFEQEINIFQVMSDLNSRKDLTEFNAGS